MKTVLIFTKNQFGYITDYLMYCKYLKEKYSFIFVCVDENKKKIVVEDVQVFYSSAGYFNFVSLIKKILSTQKVDLLVFKYFIGCTVLKLLFSGKILFDLRSASVDANVLKRKIFDNLVRLEALFFTHISTINVELACKVFGKSNKIKIIPLGAEEINYKDRQFGSYSLIYVGTLYNRKIIDTIRGIKIFYEKYNLDIELNYDIIGDGPEFQLMQDEIIKLNLSTKISMYGMIPYANLYSYFEKVNIGISYVPMTSYFSNQPPTKIFEYYLSGMPVIATKTIATIPFVKDEFGVLIKDTPESFADGLYEIIQNYKKWNSKSIKDGNIVYHWKNICDDYSNYLNSILNMV